ncbi:GspH/FimT family pseudopilin [Methylobacterium gossipiicola]|uniref:Type II secretion system protein H n=1 Tax=Methylobacterium gossipiicola TaxID=582675 RepID=A0A1I2X3E8_9HYPH|nr:GspH/FimT family pseudopilin [Methylobacterium gossipiicola]SFH07547.1 general secretion pathway protein H [Methylobacterium gossipiicola]
MRAGEDGFSLVEMLVVLAILGLAAASAGPALDTLVPARRLERTAETLRTEIDLLRAEAIRTGRPMRLALDGPGRLVSSRPGAPAIPLPVALRLDVPAGARVEPGAIRFRPDGSTSGARVFLTLGRAARVLTVSPLTGLVAEGMP